MRFHVAAYRPTYPQLEAPHLGVAVLNATYLPTSSGGSRHSCQHSQPQPCPPTRKTMNAHHKFILVSFFLARPLTSTATLPVRNNRSSSFNRPKRW